MAHFKYLRDQDQDVQKDLASASRLNEDLLILDAQAQADALSQELGRLVSSPKRGANASLGRINQIQEKTRALETSLR